MTGQDGQKTKVPIYIRWEPPFTAEDDKQLLTDFLQLHMVDRDESTAENPAIDNEDSLDVVKEEIDADTVAFYLKQERVIDGLTPQGPVQELSFSRLVTIISAYDGCIPTNDKCEEKPIRFLTDESVAFTVASSFQNDAHLANMVDVTLDDLKLIIRRKLMSGKSTVEFDSNVTTHGVKGYLKNAGVRSNHRGYIKWDPIFWYGEMPLSKYAAMKKANSDN